MNIIGRLAVIFGMIIAFSGCSDPHPGTAEIREGEVTSKLGPFEAQSTNEVVTVGEVVVLSPLLPESGGVRVVDTRSGKELWTEDKVFGNAVWVGSDFVVLGVGEQRVEVRELDTGKVRFDFSLEPDSGDSSNPTVTGVTESTIYLHNPSGTDSHEFSGIDVKTGDSRWTKNLKGDHNAIRIVSTPRDLPNVGFLDSTTRASSGLIKVSGSPVVLITHYDDASNFKAIDGKSGNEQFQFTFDKVSLQNLVATSTMLDSTTVAMSIDADVSECSHTALVGDIESGESHQITIESSAYDGKAKKWSCDGGDDGVQVAEDAVYGQDAKHRPQVMDVASGEKVWTAKGAGEPLIYGDGVAVYRSVSSDGAGDVHAVDVESGKELWSSDDVTPNADSTITNGQLITYADDATLVSDLRTGKAQWHMNDAKLVGQDDEHYLFAKVDSGSDKTSFMSTRHNGKAK